MEHRPNRAADPLGDAARERFGLSYLFPYQRLVIGNIIEAAGSASSEEDRYRRQIVILPTGAGKSLCFQLPATLLDGPTLVIFPLLSLIADQARRLKERGIACGVLTGSTPQRERVQIMEAAGRGEIPIVLANPETALTDAVLDALKRMHCIHLVIDEAHCVAEWGESFRPIYLRLGELIALDSFEVVTAFTATASPTVLEKIRRHLFGDLESHLIQGNPDRENIRYHIIPTLCKEHTLCRLLATGGRFGRPALIFCRSRTGAEQTARLLRQRLQEAEIFFYHAGLEREEKRRIEQWFFDSDDGILASTCAYGMGVDKGNIRTVYHLDLPNSVESYLQESGRGGRDRQMADAVLITSNEEGNRCSDITKEIERRRCEEMLGYILTGAGCRRAYLLSLLGAESEGCSGCDRCDGTAIETPPEREPIMRWLRRHPRRYPIEEAVHLLGALPTPIGSMDSSLRLRDGWGLLRGWREDDIHTALESLLRDGHITGARRGPWRRRLSTKQPHQ